MKPPRAPYIAMQIAIVLAAVLLVSQAAHAQILQQKCIHGILAKLYG